MPTFNTGTSWDQGLNSLASALFPDPASIARAGYYGALQRNERLKGDEAEQQRAALAALPNIHPWGTGAPPQYTAPGPGVPGIQVPRGPWPAAPAGTAVATPSMPPMPAMQAMPPMQAMQGQVPSAAPSAAPPVAAPGQMPTAVPGQTPSPVALTTGQPPIVASPAPGSGAPPSPTSTGSDGSIPQNDMSSGMFHPGSLTPPGGGMKATGPAQADGSPAPALDLMPLITTAMRAGYRGEDIANIAASYTDEAYQRGMIDQNTYSQILASLGRAGLLQSQTQIAQQGMITGATAGEQRYEFNKVPVYIVQNDGTIGAIPRDQWLANPGAYRVVEPGAASALASANYGLKDVFEQGPDGQPDLNRTRLMSGTAAAAGNYMPVPSGYSPTGKDTAGAETAGFQRGVLVDQAVEKMYAPTPRQGIGDLSRQEPALMTAEARASVMNLANQIFQNDPRLRNDQKNFPLAVDKALAQMQQAGQLPTADAIRKARARGYLDVGGKKPLTGEDPALMDDGNGKFAFRIDLIKPPAQGKGPAPGPQTTGAAPQARLQQPQAQNAQAGIPMSGAQEGSVHLNAQGVPLIVHRGVAVPLTPAEQQQYQALVKTQGKKQAVSGQ